MFTFSCYQSLGYVRKRTSEERTILNEKAKRNTLLLGLLELVATFVSAAHLVILSIACNVTLRDHAHGCELTANVVNLHSRQVVFDAYFFDLFVLHKLVFHLLLHYVGLSFRFLDLFLLDLDWLWLVEGIS